MIARFRLALTMLPSIRQILNIYNLDAKKQLSQNFILNKNILRKVAEICSPVSPWSVLEIGPGPGSLTRSLLSLNPTKLISIELDERFKPALQQLKETYTDQYYPIFGDALDLGDLPKLAGLDKPLGKLSVVGNLPFGVASRLLQKLISDFDAVSEDHEFILMFQKEVAERIAADPGTPEYGRLSISAQSKYLVDIPLLVPSSEFVPKPKVDAAIVKMVRKRQEYSADLLSYQHLSHLTKILFKHQNRCIRRALKDNDIILGSLNLPVNPHLRPRSMTNEDFHKLGNWILLNFPQFFT